jgi:hypothetical protein
LALGIPFGDILSFIPEFLTFGDTYFNLGFAARQENTQGYDGVTFDPDHVPQIQDLLFMKEKFPAPVGIVIKGAGLFIGMDIGINQPGLFAIYIDIGLVNADLVIAYRFYFGTLKDNSGLVCIQDLVIKIGLFVLGDCLTTHAPILTQNRTFLLDYDPRAESMAGFITMVFIWWIIGGIGPAEEPFCIIIP